MITDNDELYEYIIDLLTKSPHITAYSILIHIIPYAQENNIILPDMIQPENSELALNEISEIINSLNN